MKKHSLAEFLKSKSFYALLCVGALAIIAITMVGLNQTSVKKDNHLVDLNDPIKSDVADDQVDIPEYVAVPDNNNKTPLDTANNVSGKPNEVAKSDVEITSPVTDGSLLEFDIYDNSLVVDNTEVTQPNATPSVPPVPSTKPSTSANTTPKVETPAKEVLKPETFHFEQKNGLLWPITGNIIMNYSMDRVVNHATLGQWRTNPAVIISANVGDNVLSAAKGIVTSITNEDVSGLTVKVSIGSGYSLVYGQLEDLNVDVGDTLLEGDVIGTIAEPSKYYTVEGSNLYFQVLLEDETMDPMTLLRQ